MKTGPIAWLCALVLLPHSKAESSTTAATSKNVPLTTWTAELQFPTAAFDSYYREPSLEQQPQPIVHNVLNNKSFSNDIADPAHVNDIVPNQVNFPDPYPLPENKDATALFYQSIDTAAGIINGSAGVEGGCTRCLAAITAAQVLARAAPNNFSDAAIRLCKLVKFKPDDDCERDYARHLPEVTVWAQVLQAANLFENDGQFICNSMFGQSWCDKPEAREMKLNFSTEKPANATAPPPSGQRVKVLHLSDLHLDPRYTVGAEAVDCPSVGCCRPDPDNKIEIQHPAPLNGHPNCYTPLSLLTSALSSVAPLIGKDSTAPGTIEWTLFTGDVLPREKAKFRNDEYLGFVQSTVFKTLKYFLPQSPVFPVLGALDAFNEEPSIRHPLTGAMKDLQSQNYDRMKAIIDANQWLGKDESAAIGPHHMGYTALHPKYPKLRIIALNTNFWWLQHYYNYVNTTTPQDSIILSDLIGWLLLAEKAQERVWIVGHIPPFAEQSLPDHSGAFYQVVERFTPHVIAGIFFGHQHTDSVTIFYKAGGTDVTKEGKVAIAAWLAPSLSPKNGNPSYKVYDVDTGDFGIYESRTFFTNASTLATASATEPNAGTDSEDSQGPDSSGLIWELGCDARQVYAKASNWPSTSALNGAFWHRVGNAMLKDTASPNNNLAAIYHMYRSTRVDGKDVTGNCDEACVQATVCRMRAAKEALWNKCGSDEVTKNETGSNGSTSKRSEGSAIDLEIDIFIDPNDPDIASSGNQPHAEKRWRLGFWSKTGAMAAGFAGSASRRAATQKSQTQGQSLLSTASDYSTQITTVTGTLTSTVTIGSENGESSSIAKRAEDTDTEHDVPLEARGDSSNYGNFGDYKFTSAILGASTEAMTGLWGAEQHSDLQTEVEGHQSTGYQILNQVTSALKGQSTWTVISGSGATTMAPKAKKKPKRAEETWSQDRSPTDETSTESGDSDWEDRSVPEQPEGHGEEAQMLTDGAGIADRPQSKRSQAPADAPDTTKTSSPNVPTNEASDEGPEPSRDFPIYRPDESLNGQILRRRPASDSDPGTPNTATQANSLTEYQAIPDITPTPFPDIDDYNDLETLSTGIDMINRRDANRKPGCVSMKSSSICSGTKTYVEYTPEQRQQILKAYQEAFTGGKSVYNNLMKTMSRKTTSRWSTWTENFSAPASKRDYDIPGCTSNDNGLVCTRVTEVADDFVDKRSAMPEPTAEPEPDPEPGNKMLSIWMSVLSSVSREQDRTHVAHFTTSNPKKRNAEPEPTAQPQPEPEPEGDSKEQMWSKLKAMVKSKNEGATMRVSLSKRNAEPEPTAQPQPEPEPEPGVMNKYVSLMISKMLALSVSETWTPWSTGNTNNLHDPTWIGPPSKRTAQPAPTTEPESLSTTVFEDSHTLPTP
ncbi:hypothetical protein LTR84_008304 [Exophiala bonariae]|uniref:Calcineurin-like phosphoesterase domain-containing protein n=1 Tax=Exophiala bonariae TaxID=1690606 RepID=A0AAV9N0T5_9EURO|nr:hypothetical protein LTR84_008304 [Exophiala bonariae]